MPGVTGAGLLIRDVSWEPMIFFTRELHEGYQDDSGWTRLAAMKYGRNFKIYKRYAHITFTGVRRCPARLPRKKEWWHSDEFHLGSRSKFCLHVMFSKTDVEIPADEIRLRFENEKS